MASYRELVDQLDALLRYVRNRLPDDRSVLLSITQRLIEEAKRSNTVETRWTAFEQADEDPNTLAKLGQAAARLGVPPDQARAFLDDELKRATLWVNSRYQVAKRLYPDGGTYLSIKRIDQSQIRSWRDLQRIKTELLGPETEAVEVFPAESRLVDQANQYHLFALPPGERFPLGFDQGRLVADSADNVGEGQAPLDQS